MVDGSWHTPFKFTCHVEKRLASRFHMLPTDETLSSLHVPSRYLPAFAISANCSDYKSSQNRNSPVDMLLTELPVCTIFPFGSGSDRGWWRSAVRSCLPLCPVSPRRRVCTHSDGSYLGRLAAVAAGLNTNDADAVSRTPVLREPMRRRQRLAVASRPASRRPTAVAGLLEFALARWMTVSGKYAVSRLIRSADNMCGCGRVGPTARGLTHRAAGGLRPRPGICSGRT